MGGAPGYVGKRLAKAT